MNDLISRQALLRQIDIDADGEPGYYGDTWKFIDTIKKMPSVQPTQKKGKWVKEDWFFNSMHCKFTCLNCGYHSRSAYKYCPNCGSYM